MSTITSSTTNRHQIQGRHRKYSDELDIFEATQYFSGGVTGSSIDATTKFASYCAMREERQHAWSRPYRKNSDTPTEAMFFEKHANEKTTKKIKQSRSPAAKLANFINSLFFNQATSKKQPKPSKDGEEIHAERGTRRSISHSPSLRSRLWRGTANNIRRRDDLVWIHEQKKTGRIIGGEDDDGGESSDSSSDLFELKNYEFGPGDCSSGLPVYGSTNMGVIKRV